MGTEAPIILVLDASVLINFLRVDRIDLIGNYSARMLVTEHVVAEVTAVYPEQRARLDAAVAAGTVEVLTVTDLAELQLIAHLSSAAGKRLGTGESSAIAIASSRGCALAIDDKAAIREAKKAFPTLPIFTTQDLIVLMIRGGILTVSVADSLKDEWAQNHRFKLPIKTFGDLV